MHIPSLKVDMQTSSTGPGAPVEATSRASANHPQRCAFALAELIDAFMASYAGPDRGIGTRLTFWHADLRRAQRSKARIDYELRANDDTVLIVPTTSEFTVGACIVLSGYADGPSRAHFSFVRAQLEPSDRCQ